MPTARVGDAKAADPGIGFTLNFDSALGHSLKVVITMSDLKQPGNGSYQSEVAILNDITDTELVFVVPFGDTAYAPSNLLSFKIDLYSPYDNKNSLNTPLTGVVIGEKGSFSFSTSVPTGQAELKIGDMLQSENGAYIGIYNNDGNFNVYPQFAEKQEPLKPVYSSNTPGSTSMKSELSSFSSKALAMNSNNAPLFMANAFVKVNGEFRIDASGRLCAFGSPLMFEQYQS